MNYKVGDKVKVHTLEWFEKNCIKTETYGNNGKKTSCYYYSDNKSDCLFIDTMFNFFGKNLTIKNVGTCTYNVYEDNLAWEDWMFESPEEEHKTHAETLGDILHEISKPRIDISHDIVFISGSITANKCYKQKFAALEQKLIAKGCIVLNPAVLPEGMEHDAYMPTCYAMIDQSETVVFMQDWRISDGAKMEMIRAIKKNKRIVFEEEI